MHEREERKKKMQFYLQETETASARSVVVYSRITHSTYSSFTPLALFALSLRIPDVQPFL